MNKVSLFSSTEAVSAAQSPPQLCAGFSLLTWMAAVHQRSFTLSTPDLMVHIRTSPLSVFNFAHTHWPSLFAAKSADHGADRDRGGDAHQRQKVHPAANQRREAVCAAVRGTAAVVWLLCFETLRHVAYPVVRLSVLVLSSERPRVRAVEERADGDFHRSPEVVASRSQSHRKRPRRSGGALQTSPHTPQQQWTVNRSAHIHIRIHRYQTQTHR